MKKIKCLVMSEDDLLNEEISNNIPEGFFDDNGGETDGNSYIIPVELVTDADDLINRFGIEVKEVNYRNDYDPDLFNEKGGQWMGVQITREVYYT